MRVGVLAAHMVLLALVLMTLRTHAPNVTEEHRPARHIGTYVLGPFESRRRRSVIQATISWGG
jgi:hypothetical protein